MVSEMSKTVQVDALIEQPDRTFPVVVGLVALRDQFDWSLDELIRVIGRGIGFMLKVLLHKIAILLLFRQVSEGKDLLHLFRPKPELPRELNDFLTDVQHHKKDFAFIRHVANNQRKYVNSYRENKQLFADDIDNQMTVNPEYDIKQNELENSIHQLNDNELQQSNPNDQGSALDEYKRSNNFKSYYPEERYSKFIHSPVRLRRESERNFINKRVRVNPNGDYGNIERSEPKIPGNYRNDENRYHTGYIVGVDDGDAYDDEDDYYQEFRSPGKKKRAVEISIKSDGKLVKHIEEDENVPKSIILNIKADNPNAKASVQPLGSSAATVQSLTISTDDPVQNNNNNYLSNEPSNSKTIPNLANSNDNQNSFKTKDNIGVPINAVPVGNRANFNVNKNAASSGSIIEKPDTSKISSNRNVKEVIIPEKVSNFQSYPLPEISRISNSEGFKSKYDQNYAKPSYNNHYRPESVLDDLRWSGENNPNMAKSIDIAQNNINSGDVLGEKQSNMDLDMSDNKKDEFDRVQGLIIDSTAVNDNIKPKESYIKRQIDKVHRRDDNDNINNNLDNNENYMNGFDYAEPLELEANAYHLSDLNHNNQPQSVHWETADEKIHLDPNQTYEIFEKSTKDILVIPIIPTTSECPILDKEIEQEEEAKAIGDEVAHEIIKEEKAAEAETEFKEILQQEEKAKVIGDEIAHEIVKEEKAAEAETECEPITTEGVIEIIKHHKTHHGNEEDKNNCDETNNEELEVAEHKHKHGHEHDHHHLRYQRELNMGQAQNIIKRGAKARAKKKLKEKKYEFKDKKNENKKSKPHIEKKSKFHKEKSTKSLKEKPSKYFKRQEEQDNAYRNRKHLPTMPKYKRKRVRQHPKKRIGRDVDDQSMVDFYDLNAFYDAPEDAFDFVPSYRQRGLKSVNYEFDPNLIQDVGNREKEEIEKFQKSMKEVKSDNTNGVRKKYKSEGDYADEEDSLTAGPPKKFPIKKTQNQFATDSHRTTEENDDDYNYSDLTDMDDEDEDIAYEEEDVKGDKLEVDEAVGKNNRNEHENDRRALNLPKDQSVPVINLDQMVSATEKNPKSSVNETCTQYNIDDVMLEAKQVLASAHGHGRGGTAKKKTNKKPKREIQEQGVERQLRGRESAIVNRKRRRKRKRSISQGFQNDGNEINAKNLDLESIANIHGRGPHAKKSVKYKKINPKRQIEGYETSNQNIVEDPFNPQMANNKKLSDQYQEKPLSSEEKQNIFLRYNPEFQRWPRFIQSDNKYHELMRRRALENRRRYFRNAHRQNNFPISNEYFLDRRPVFVKRQEPVNPSGEAGASPSAPAASGENAEGNNVPASSNPPEAAASSNPPEAAAPAEEAGLAKQPDAEVSSTSESAAPAVGGDGSETLASQPLSESLPDMNAGLTATLPQAAQNILQTANSGIFDNTMVPGFGGALGGDNSLTAGGGATLAATQFHFTTNKDDLTENTQCDTTVKKDSIKPCPDEIAGHSPVNLTSVLPLIPDSTSRVKLNISRDEFLDLTELLGGILPRHIVSESLSNAKGNVRDGLKAGRFNMNLMLSNYNSSAETNLILTEMTNLMMQLKYHTACQALPTNLLSYVKVITRNEMDDPMTKLREMNEIDFDEHQSSYVFRSGPSDSVNDKAEVLKELLNKYNNLPTDCKERAEPVKEYIESHLAMIDRMVATSVGTKPANAVATATTVAEPATTDSGHSSAMPKAKKEINASDFGNNENLENQMMEEGLKNRKPDANEVIESPEMKNKREDIDSALINNRIDDKVHTSTSPQYGKLAEAVRKAFFLPPQRVQPPPSNVPLASIHFLIPFTKDNTTTGRWLI